jgi:hypothetical protein
MKAIISTTYNDNYLFFLPITTWSWNKLGVDVICFMPKEITQSDSDKINLQENIFKKNVLSVEFHLFDCNKNKEATYSQCSRLYAGALEKIPDNEILVTSDIDMSLFEVPPHSLVDEFTVFGADLVPNNQYPICYISATKRKWKEYFNVGDKTVQQCLDELLGNIDCENMRGNYWAKDQETAFNLIFNKFPVLVNRSKPRTQFATKRLDRDDAFLLERDMTDIIDFHMPRPGYDYIETIIKVFETKYPFDDFTWMREYADAYKQLI